MSKAVVYLVMPRAGAFVAHGAALGLAHAARGDVTVMIPDHVSSAYMKNFNGSWYDCLNNRDWGDVQPTHYAMLHADVCPAPGWLDVYLDEMERLDCDVLSGVVSFRDFSNLTSTAIENPDWRHQPEELWAPRRLTIPEILRMPESFSIADTDTPNSRLLFNCGLMLVRLRGRWMDEVEFIFRHRRTRLVSDYYLPDGARTPAGLRVFEMRSEDWEFSRACHERGLSVYCTRKVPIGHVGEWMWMNQAAHQTCPHCRSVLGQVTDELYWERQKRVQSDAIQRAVDSVLTPRLAELERRLAAHSSENGKGEGCLSASSR